MKLKPIGNKVVILRDKAEETTKGGIVIPDNAKEETMQGTVIAVGPGHWDAEAGKFVPVTLTEGDRVVFRKFAGTEVKVESETYLVLTEADVYAKIE